MKKTLLAAWLVVFTVFGFAQKNYENRHPKPREIINMGIVTSGLVFDGNPNLLTNPHDTVVATWTDSSGNSNNATATNGATAKVSRANSRKSFSFDGTNDAYTLPNILNAASAGEIFIVLRPNLDPPTDVFKAGVWTFSNAEFGAYPTTGTFGAGIYDGWGSTVRKSLGRTDPPLVSGYLSSNFTLYNVISAAGEWTANTDGSQIYTTSTNTPEFIAAPKIGVSSDTNYDSWFSGEIARVLVYNRKLTTSERNQNKAELGWLYALNYHTFTKQVIFEGDSITAYNYSWGAFGQPYPTKVSDLLGSEWRVHNVGESAETVAQMVTQGASQVDAKYNGSYSRNVAVLFGGTNDLFYFDTGLSSLQTNTASWMSSRISTFGADVFVCTMLPRQDAYNSTQKEADRITFNAWLRTNYGSRVIDLAADSRLSDPQNQTCFYSDNIHLRDAGNAVIAALVNAKLNPVADTTAPTVTSFSASAVSDSQINLSFAATDNIAVTGWDLDYSPNGSSGWTALLSNSGSGSPFPHTGLTASTAYYYRFRARDAAGNVSGYSTANATTQATPPTPPVTISDLETFQHCADYGLTEEIEFNRLRGDFGDGFQSSYLIGANTGNKEWKLNFKVLPQTNDNSISFGGLSLNRADYLWDFYCRYAVSGKPFILKSPRNEQFYLAEFADDKLSFELFAVKLWSTGVRMRQRRIRAVSVFDIAKLKPWAWFAADKFTNFNNGQNVSSWADSSGNSRNLAAIEANSVPIYGTTAGNATKPAVYWDGAKNGLQLTANANLKNIFAVCKYSDATFSTYNGLISALGYPILTGQTGTAKFLDGSFGNLAVYRKNGKSYAANNQLAPVANGLGLVSLRLPEGAAITGITLGRDRNISATVTHLWKGSIAEVVLFDSLLTETDERELFEHFLTKYEIYG